MPDSVRRAQYRTGDWKGCIETLMKPMRTIHDNNGGGYGHWLFLAMAYWQLGDKEKARSWFVRDEPEGWDSYEKRMRIRDSNKARLFLPTPHGFEKSEPRRRPCSACNRSEGEVKPKPAPEPVRPPK